MFSQFFGNPYCFEFKNPFFKIKLLDFQNNINKLLLNWLVIKKVHFEPDLQDPCNSHSKASWPTLR